MVDNVNIIGIVNTFWYWFSACWPVPKPRLWSSRDNIMERKKFTAWDRFTEEKWNSMWFRPIWFYKCTSISLWYVECRMYTGGNVYRTEAVFSSTHIATKSGGKLIIKFYSPLGPICYKSINSFTHCVTSQMLLHQGTFRVLAYDIRYISPNILL